jgi:hypothetical protein
VSPRAIRQNGKRFEAHRNRGDDNEAPDCGRFHREHSVDSIDDGDVYQDNNSGLRGGWGGRERGFIHRGNMRSNQGYRRDSNNQRNSYRQYISPYGDLKSEYVDDQGLYRRRRSGSRDCFRLGPGGERGNRADRFRASRDCQQRDSDFGDAQGDNQGRNDIRDPSSFIHPDRARLMSPDDERERNSSMPTSDHQTELASEPVDHSCDYRKTKVSPHVVDKDLLAEDGHQWVRSANSKYRGRSKGRAWGGRGQNSQRGRRRDRDHDRSSASPAPYVRSSCSPRLFEHLKEKKRYD